MFRPRSKYVSILCSTQKNVSRIFFFDRALTCARLWKSKHKVSTSRWYISVSSKISIIHMQRMLKTGRLVVLIICLIFKLFGTLYTQTLSSQPVPPMRPNSCEDGKQRNRHKKPWFFELQWSQKYKKHNNPWTLQSMKWAALLGSCSSSSFFFPTNNHRLSEVFLLEGFVSKCDGYTRRTELCGQPRDTAL